MAFLRVSECWANLHSTNCFTCLINPLHWSLTKLIKKLIGFGMRWRNNKGHLINFYFGGLRVPKIKLYFTGLGFVGSFMSMGSYKTEDKPIGWEATFPPEKICIYNHENRIKILYPSIIIYNKFIELMLQHFVSFIFLY